MAVYAIFHIPTASYLNCYTGYQGTPYLLPVESIETVIRGFSSRFLSINRAHLINVLEQAIETTGSDYENYSILEFEIHEMDETKIDTSTHEVWL